MRVPEAVVAGHLCLDMMPAFSGTGGRSLAELLTPGALVNVGSMAVSTGGAVSNTGISLELMGVDTLLLGKVGDDLFGEGIARIVEGHGIDSSALLRAPGEDTSYSVVLSPPGSDRVFLHNPGCNDTFCAEDVDFSAFSGVRLFHFGYPPLMRRMYSENGRELVELMRRAREAGITASLDMSLPDPASESGMVDWLKILEGVLPYVDLFVPSIDEIMFMLCEPGPFTFDMLPSLARKLLDMGAAAVFIKLGELGSYALTSHDAHWPDRELYCEPFAVPPESIVNTAGAGDTCIAGFLAGMLRSLPLGTAMRLGNAAGALNIQVRESVGGARPVEEILAMLPCWPSKPQSPDRGYWTPCGPGLYAGKNDRGE